MNPHDLEDLLGELERFGLSNDAEQTEHARKLLNLERPTAELVDLLIRSSHRRSVLEIGTSNGYSTLWIARALQGQGGSMHTIERDPAKHDSAAANLHRAGLSHIVVQHLGDATAIVRTLDLPFDCVLFDADRISAPEQLRLLLPRLSSDVLLLCDNVLSHPAEVREYLDLVHSLPGFTFSTVPVGKGLHVALRSSAASPDLPRA